MTDKFTQRVSWLELQVQHQEKKASWFNNVSDVNHRAIGGITLRDSKPQRKEVLDHWTRDIWQLCFNVFLDVPDTNMRLLLVHNRLSSKGRTSRLKGGHKGTTSGTSRTPHGEWLFLLNQGIMAIGLPANCVNPHINYARFTKRPMSKPWRTPTIISAWDSDLVRCKDASDSAVWIESLQRLQGM